ncbi:MAG TPA: DUF5663 domain-containing protein [bacterium]|nr:DUF5663 domain-containing protein [bacterium]
MDQGFSSQNNTTGFQDDIFTAIGAGSIPGEDKGKLLAQMLQIIQVRALERIINSLSEEKALEMERIAGDEKNSSLLEKFLEDNVPNYQDIFKEETENLRQQLISKYSR